MTKINIIKWQQQRIVWQPTCYIDYQYYRQRNEENWTKVVMWNLKCHCKSVRLFVLIKLTLVFNPWAFGLWYQVTNRINTRHIYNISKNKNVPTKTTNQQQDRRIYTKYGNDIFLNLRLCIADIVVLMFLCLLHFKH